MLIGVISDTHGLLRPEAVEALHGVEHILHAGDVGDIAILDALRKSAPVDGDSRKCGCVRGRVRSCQRPRFVELGGSLFYLVHSVHDLDINPVAAGVAMVVSGHSHKASVQVRDGVVFFNPGSAGPRRFSLPVTVGFVTAEDGVEASVMELAVR